MKKTNSIILPFLLFLLLIFINNLLFWQKNFIDLNWRYFLAFYGGISRDIFLFSIIALLLGYISNVFPVFKKLSIITIHLLFFLPIFDYFYFRATLERFNWVVLQFINSNSTKGYIGNMGFELIYIVVFLLILVLSCYYCFKGKIVDEKLYKPLIALCIFAFFSSLFTSNIVFSKETNFTGHIKVVDGKNRILSNLSSGSIYGFFTLKGASKKSNKFKPYTQKEKAFLEKYGLIPVQSKIVKEAQFDRVIMVVMESFALEYLHYINKDIPSEASPYFDYLMANYPHLNNFYTSDFPSLQGFNVLLSSKIPFNENNHNNQKYNLATLMENKYPKSTWFFRGSSRVYGNEEIAVSKVFGFSHLIGYEDLALKYKEPKGYVWGYLDNILYSEAIDTLLTIKNSRYFMILKLLNQHQPIFSSIANSSGQPKSVSEHSNNIVKSIYDADKLLKKFVALCEENNILDEKTLLIVTSDHYPPLGYGHKDLIKDENCHSQLGKLPFIFVTKNKEVFKSINENTLCCQLDIAPTLCELLGFPIPKEYMGQSLLSSEFKNRSIGLLNNETLFFQSESLEFAENISNVATSTIAIRKWLNNLY